MEKEQDAYYPRIADLMLEEEMGTFPGVLIVGPKDCGKTTTAKRHVKSVVDFSDIKLGEYYINLATNDINSLFDRQTPILFDEWQYAPIVFQGVKQMGDQLNRNGLYLLTGSITKNIILPHNGAGRITRFRMYPMSLYESKESSGEISLKDLIDGKGIKTCYSPMSPDDLIFAACRGGWPKSLLEEGKEKQLKIARDLYRIIPETDMSVIDGVKRKTEKVDALTKSLARNIISQVSEKTIMDDVYDISGESMSKTSFDSYINLLERLFIVERIKAWAPNIRSKSVLRVAPKYNFIDPSIAVAALGASPEYYKRDLESFGYVFESMCIRDIKIYASLYGGSIGFYHDKTGLECDIVLFLPDRKYALMEVKFGSKDIDKAVKNLNELDRLIEKHDADLSLKSSDKYGKPLFKAVLTGTRVSETKDGVFIIPIGTLKY